MSRKPETETEQLGHFERGSILDEVMQIALERGVQKQDLTADQLDDVLNEIEDEVRAERAWLASLE